MLRSERARLDEPGWLVLVAVAIVYLLGICRVRHAVTSQGSPHRVLALLQELQRLHEAEARDARARGDRDQIRHLRDIAADIDTLGGSGSGRIRAADRPRGTLGNP